MKRQDSLWFHTAIFLRFGDLKGIFNERWVMGGGRWVVGGGVVVNISKIQPKYSRSTAEMQPRSRREAVEIEVPG